MQVSQAGIDLIAASEGLRLTAYKCPAGKWTIGYGHTTEAGPPAVRPGMTITQQQAWDILMTDVDNATQNVIECVKVPLTQGQIDALVDFTFNFGIGRLKESTFLKLLNNGEYDKVPAQLMRWVNATDPNTGVKGPLKGLITRRRAECALWRGMEDESDNVDPEEMRATPDVPVPDKSIFKSREAIAAATTIAAGASGSVGKITEQMDSARTFAEAAHKLISGPGLWIGLVVMLGGAAVIYYRHMRLRDTGS